MVKKISVLPSYSLIRKERGLLLLKEVYKDLLLRYGVEEIETLIEKNREASTFVVGRTIHPSIPIQGGRRMIVRKYTHGGLLRALSRDLYLFGSRPFQELAITEEIRSCGLPTIEPIGAIRQAVFPFFYKGYFLSLEIPHAVDLLHYLQSTLTPSLQDILARRRILRSIALLLKQFHESGFLHSDLQLRNILISEGRPLLIDFDRSYRKKRLTAQDKIQNLLRLHRSAEKWQRLGLPITRTDRWRFFLIYAGEDKLLHEAMRKALRVYSIRSFFHRLGWAFEGIIRRAKRAEGDREN